MTTSPLVVAYLVDLDRALAGADPADRLEIVDAVREHIDAALAELGASPTQAEVAGVLRRLGTADDVAAAWATGTDGPTPPRAPRYPHPGVTSSPAQLYPPPRSGLPGWAIALIVVLGVLLAGPLLLLVLGWFLFAARVGGAGGAAWGVWTLPVLLLVATVVAGIARRRSTAHRTGWTVAFVVLLVIDLGAVAVGAGLLVSNSGGAVESPGVVVEQIPTPHP